MRRVDRTSRVTSCAHLGLLAAVAPLVVQAQEASSSSTQLGQGLEEITVTASRREERLQDVAISVTVVDPEKFASAGMTEITSVLPFVPGVAVQDGGGNYSNDVYIRGVYATGAGGVGTYIDDIPYGSSTKDSGGGAPIDGTLLDLADVSVLKGPQGTLYGASAMGGVIKYKTREPSTQVWSGSVAADLSDTHGGGLNQLYRASINGPIAQDRLGVSFTGFWKDKAGFIDNVTIPKSGWDDYEYYGGSATLLYTPTEALRIKALGLYQKSTQEGFATVRANNITGAPMDGEFAVISPSVTPSVYETKVVGLDINYDMGFATLTSVTSYQKKQIARTSDLTTPFAGFADTFFPANAPHTEAIFNGTMGWERKTQELRLTSESNKSFEWLGGVFYSKEEGYNTQVINTVPAEPEFFWVDFPSAYKEWAAFGTATYYFTEAFDVSVGYRYSKTDNSVRLDAIGPLVGTLPQTLFKDEVSTFLLNARYRPSDGLSWFARAANGFRPGEANFRIADTSSGAFLSDAFVKPDDLWSYEIGVKGLAPGGRFNYELTAFYIDWKDFQLNVLRGGILVATNGKHASSKGLEGALSVLLTDAFSVTATAGYTDAQLEVNDANVGGRSGEQLPNTPQWTATLGFNYGFDAVGLPAYFSGSYRYNGSFPVGFGGVTVDGTFYRAASPRYVNDSYGLLNLQLGVNTGRYEAALYATNLLDEYAYANILTSYTGPATATPLRPRTVGMTFKVKFE